MEQVFFINPVAGKRDASAELVPQIQAAARQLQLPQPQIVVTQYAGQAREAAHRYAASGTPVALYACSWAAKSKKGAWPAAPKLRT